ncbi:MAG: hypothetical protein NZ922_05530 [Candidatus Methanomethyliaceae archaeon]|nr:hypothetical protein [Candidatus Methanomethyliaceae archaeon]MDW7971227.1 lipoate protein ligase C-terminal domain-containing protein [Nitrososphaerota archaeon]
MRIGIKKVEGGKLVKVKILEEEGIIKEIRIAGDFFVHPEEAIEELEEFLKGIPLNKVRDRIREFMNEKKIRLVGLKIDDLVEVIEGSK